MSAPGRSAHVPTLTEVVHVDVPLPAEAAAAAVGTAPAQPQAEPPAHPPGPDWSQTVRLSGGTSALDEAVLTQSVLADVQRQVDLMLEYRLREAIAPALARASDALIRDLRAELAEALREIVARAVAQELARHRHQPAPR
jgi:hypothetical protein